MIDSINAVMNCEIKKDNLIRCPHCKESYYMYLYSDTTLAYCPPIYKNGVLINNECRNKSKDYYECMHCGTSFAYKDGVPDENYTTPSVNRVVVDASNYKGKQIKTSEINDLFW